MNEREIVVRTRGLTRTFGDLTAVDQLDLTICRGAIYGFLGPNGSGKTTTIRMLAGLLTPTAGEISILGLSIPAEADQLKHYIGYMTQHFSLYQDLSVEENLAFIAAVQNLSPAQSRQRLKELLADYHLEKQRRQRAGTLSGGQRQRLMLAAATLHHPELLFLDEPTSAVDPQSRRDFWEKLFQLSDRGTTILVSTHYMDEAERCHQLAILDHGALATRGEPRAMMADIPAQVVQIETRKPRACANALQQQPWIIGVTQIGNHLRAQVNSEVEDAPGDIARQLQRAGLQAQCEKVSATLEDVFVVATCNGER